MAQSVRCRTLDFSSGHDLRIIRSSPSLASALGMEQAWDALSSFPTAPHIPSLSLSLKIKNINFKKGSCYTDTESVNTK